MMKPVHLTLFLLAALAISGCGQAPSEARYQFVSAQSGDLYRLDTRSGEMRHVTPDGASVLAEGIPVLRVGNYYHMSDAKQGDPYFLKYLGEGKFETSAYSVVKTR